MVQKSCKPKTGNLSTILSQGFMMPGAWFLKHSLRWHLGGPDPWEAPILQGRILHQIENEEKMDAIFGGKPNWLPPKNLCIFIIFSFTHSLFCLFRKRILYWKKHSYVKQPLFSRVLLTPPPWHPTNSQPWRQRVPSHSSTNSNAQDLWTSNFLRS